MTILKSNVIKIGANFLEKDTTVANWVRWMITTCDTVTAFVNQKFTPHNISISRNETDRLKKFAQLLSE
jgi:hypothetical protein